jgi:pyruvate dehydrogenase E2 component (dihydrolipoamide acetyltransferase)
MAVTLVMPKLGMAMSEGEVVKWARDDGAQVAKDDVVVTIMSKKITYEVRAPEDGILHHGAQPKQKLPVGAAIGFVTAPGEAIPETPQQAVAMPAVAPVRQVRRPTPTPSTVTPAGEILATPAAKRLARERGIDLAEVTGTGPGGRIQEQDVLGQVERAAGAPAVVPRGAARLNIPFAGMRKAIAEQMTDSLRTMAQVTITTEADVTPLIDLHERLKRTTDLSLTTLMVKATASALHRHPLLNASLVGDEIQLLADINLGVGVALEEGLIVTVIRNADRLAVGQIDQELKRLSSAARAGSLNVDEVTGGTFTITNLGMYGVDAFTPIINPPEVAILGVGRVIEKPAVYRGEIARRSLMVLSLTFDHRLVDGAPAAAFLQTVREMLEQPALAFAEQQG